MKQQIPKEITNISKKLNERGFEAYLVGGCVRDLILNRKPKDWDFTTNASPEEIIGIFDKTFYENKYGTVGIVNEPPSGGVLDETLNIVEVTPYRTESEYSDSRRPDEVYFGATLVEDLNRRDFTINAIAFDPYKGQIIDPHKGQNDIKDKIIKAVGNPESRFKEDGLRVLRAIRIATELGFTINNDTKNTIESNPDFIKNISKERIRDEFIRIIMSDNPTEGLILSHKLGVLKHIIPEIEETIGIEQNQAHSFDVWTHLLKSLEHSANKKMNLILRLASLFHDISKPETRRWSKEKNDWTFYGHDVVGARRTQKILKDLRFPNELVEKVVKLVRWHMFFSDTDQITLSAVRRIVSNVGKDNVWDLMDLRTCDRIGTGRPKESPYRLRKYRSMVEEVLTDPISVSMLKIDGKKIMEITKLKPGPKIGFILHILLDDVLENPTSNNDLYLTSKAKKLAKIPENELKDIGEKAKKKKECEEEKKVTEIRSKHWVK